MNIKQELHCLYIYETVEVNGERLHFGLERWTFQKDSTPGHRERITQGWCMTYCLYFITRHRCTRRMWTVQITASGRFWRPRPIQTSQKFGDAKGVPAPKMDSNFEGGVERRDRKIPEASDIQYQSTRMPL